MNEQDLKEMIRSLLSEMDTDTVTELKKEEQTQNSEFKSLEKNGVQPDKEETTIEDGIIPDITEVDIQEQFLVPNAINEEAYRKIKKFTPARLGLWRAGNRYKTETVLRFRADHAAAQDAVFSYVSDDFVKEMGFIPVQTKAAT